MVTSSGSELLPEIFAIRIVRLERFKRGFPPIKAFDNSYNIFLISGGLYLPHS